MAPIGRTSGALGHAGTLPGALDPQERRGATTHRQLEPSVFGHTARVFYGGGTPNCRSGA